MDLAQIAPRTDMIIWERIGLLIFWMLWGELDILGNLEVLQRILHLLSEFLESEF